MYSLISSTLPFMLDARINGVNNANFIADPAASADLSAARESLPFLRGIADLSLDSSSTYEHLNQFLELKNPVSAMKIDKNYCIALKLTFFNWN